MRNVEKLIILLLLVAGIAIPACSQTEHKSMSADQKPVSVEQSTPVPATGRNVKSP